jgi:CubicO group peptidase (beta-lactamase class C family)/predicted secreted Zn-dependent protease
MRRTSPRPTSFRVSAAIVALATATCHQAAAAQTFDVGDLHRDVTVEINPQPYAVRGRMAQELGDQLRSRSPGGAWTQFPLFFYWDYEEEPERYSARDTLSERCRVSSFTLRMEFNAVYPEWDQPSDAPPDVVEAWRSLQATITRQWEERRDSAVQFGLKLSREARLVETSCPLVDSELKALVDRRLDAFNKSEENAQKSGHRISLSWPPPGFAGRLAQAASPPRSPSSPPPPSQPSRDRPPPPQPRDRSPPPSGTVVLPDSSPTGPVASDIYEAFDRDGSTSGVVAALYYMGQLQAARAFTRTSPAAPDTLTLDDTVAFPGLTELLVATLSAALDSAGVLDLNEPISRYLADVDPQIGQVTLAQLLSHRSGIGNAAPPPPDSLDWAGAVGKLDSRALFTVPGVVFSYSDYDYLLAVRVLEAVTHVPIADAMRQALFVPLGMSSTSLGAPLNGLPVAVTSMADMERLVTAWMSGEVRGAPSLAQDGASSAAESAPTFRNGVWYDTVGGQRRVSLICSQAGLQVFPDTRSALLIWSRGSWPSETQRFLLHGLDSQLHVGDAILHSGRVTGAGSVEQRSERCSEPLSLATPVMRAGEPAEVGRWPGRYTNGDRYFELDEADGHLVVPGPMPLTVTQYAGDLYFATVNGQTAYPIRLLTDAAARRYLVLGDRAYVHDDDAPTRR